MASFAISEKAREHSEQHCFQFEAQQYLKESTHHGKKIGYFKCIEKCCTNQCYVVLVNSKTKRGRNHVS